MAYLHASRKGRTNLVYSVRVGSTKFFPLHYLASHFVSCFNTQYCARNVWMLFICSTKILKRTKIWNIKLQLTATKMFQFCMKHSVDRKMLVHERKYNMYFRPAVYSRLPCEDCVMFKRVWVDEKLYKASIL